MVLPRECPINVRVFVTGRVNLHVHFDPSGEWWIVEDRAALEVAIEEVGQSRLLKPVRVPPRDEDLMPIVAEYRDLLDRWWREDRLRLREPTPEERLILMLLPRCAESVGDGDRCPAIGTREGYDGTSWCEEHAATSYKPHEWAEAYFEWGLALGRRVHGEDGP